MAIRDTPARRTVRAARIDGDDCEDTFITSGSGYPLDREGRSVVWADASGLIPSCCESCALGHAAAVFTNIGPRWNNLPRGLQERRDRRARRPWQDEIGRRDAAPVRRA